MQKKGVVSAMLTLAKIQVSLGIMDIQNPATFCVN